MPDNKWARLLAYVTGLVNQKLLLQNEYLAAENRILRALCVVNTRSLNEINNFVRKQPTLSGPLTKQVVRDRDGN